MKRVVLLLVFLAINVFAMAQDTIKIKGVPVQSKFNTFVREIKNKGFEAVFENDECIVLNGKFIDEDCSLIIQNSGGNISNIIIVIKKDYSMWSSMKGKYEDIVELFTKKFGKPGNVVERYESPFEKGDGYEMTALKSGKLVCASYFYIGDYIISIGTTKECNIMIGYTNKKMLDNKQEQRINDI